MSDTATDAQAPAQDADATTTDAEKPKADEVDWKAEARKWEQRAKENKTAADELAQIRESQKSEAEKVADRLAKAEQRAAQAEARATRREIAIEFTLDKDDAALLDDLSDEDAMRRLAGRLQAAKADAKKHGNVSPREGNTQRPTTDSKRDFLRGLTGQD